jgi:hypothetical protein
MSTYAELNTDNIVINVIVADAEFVATQTDKTYVEYTDENPAGIGFTYSADADVFVAPQPYPSWTLDSNHDWQPPTPYPTDGETYSWNEEELAWAGI